MNAIEEILNWKPNFWTTKGGYQEYEKSYYCNPTKEIHKSMKQKLNCTHCGPTMLEKMEYEAIKRLEWFISGYFIHNLNGILFSKLPTERLCELYNVKLTHFRPWTQ
jgi:hypothetical protein